MPLGRSFSSLVILSILALMAIGSLVTAVIAQDRLAADNLAAVRDTSARQRHFVILDQDGYGTNDCLEKQGGCGKIIADSFCESKGFKLSESHRRADPDDVTGSIATQKPNANRITKAFVISCR